MNVKKIIIILTVIIFLISLVSCKADSPVNTASLMLFSLPDYPPASSYQIPVSPAPVTAPVDQDNPNSGGGAPPEESNICTFADGYDCKETFTNSAAGSSYGSGSFTGVQSVNWSYFQARNEGDYPIDGKGLMLRWGGETIADPPSKIEATISGGIGNFAVDFRKAYTSGTTRKLEVYVNDVLKGSISYDFLAGTDLQVQTFTVNNINIPGDFVLRIQIPTNFTGSGRQVTIDNIRWSKFE